MAFDSCDEFKPSGIHLLGPAFQLRIVVFSNPIPALTLGGAFTNHQPRYRRDRETTMNDKNTNNIVAANAIFCQFVNGFPRRRGTWRGVSRRNGGENNKPDSHLPQFVRSQTGQEDSEEIGRILARMMESRKGKQGAPHRVDALSSLRTFLLLDS
jgi:hypothetical protein